MSKITTGIANNFTPTTQKNLPKYSTPYIGFVRDISDVAKMNRISVWIPELASDNKNNWYKVNWCSPFAGATPTDKTFSQTSFGMWFSPPAVGNQVLVLFVNGDPNMGFYIGGIYQQFMNNMVPGIPDSTLNTSNSGKSNDGPATEYNKTDNVTSTDPARPAFKPLTDALANQGLSSDTIRGSSTSSGRRSSPSNVNGILTQGGNQLVMDDDEDNAFIRFRTKNGTQIMINDTVGNIYMCTRNGNSWLELSDSGIDVYTTRRISMRSVGDFNIHSDSNINFYAAKSINLCGVGGITMATDQSINTIVGNQFNLQTEGEITFKSSADVSIIGSGNVGIDSGSTLAIRACESIGITACGTIYNKGSVIKLNSGDGPTPSSGTDATIDGIKSIKDIEVNKSNGYNSISTKSNVSRLPSHEPFAGHPYVSEASDTVALNTLNQTRTQIGTSGTTAPSQSTDITSTSNSGNSTNTSNVSTSNGTTLPNNTSSKTISNVEQLSDGSIKTTYNDGSTSTDTYDSSTGTYYSNGYKSQPLSSAEVRIQKSLLNQYSSGNSLLNTSTGTNGVDIFTSATSKSKSSLLGLANVGLVAASVLSKMNSGSRVPSVQKTTTPINAIGENWESPVSGKIVTLYSDSNYGIMIQPTTTQIVADKSGTIIWAGNGKVGSLYNGYTNCVVIDHGDGTQSLLSNLNTISVSVNDSIIQGNSIGTVSLNTNIHYEIRSEGIPIDPSTENANLGTLNKVLVIGK